MYKRIVVPLDGSELAERALSHAVHLAEQCGAAVHLLRVVDLARIERLGPFGLGLEQVELDGGIAEATAAADGYLAKIEASLIEQGVRVSDEIRRGNVGDEILAAAHRGDLIVMASHGRGGISRWYLGSVTEHVLRHSANPVLVVRAETPLNEAFAGVNGTAEAR